MKSLFKKAKNVALVFGLCQLIIGSVFIWLNPPFQGPDEINHVYRAYAVSQGHLSPNLETYPNRRGGMVAQSLVDAAEKFSHLRWYATEKTSFKKIHLLSNVMIDYDKEIFIDYPNTAVYPFLVYLPNALGFKIAKILNFGVLPTLYMARFTGLLFWCVLSGVMLWCLPIYRVLFGVLMVLPMSIYTHGLVTADTFVNGIAFLLVAFVLRKTVKEVDFTWLDVGILASITFFLVGGKLVYTPMLLLALIIPASKFKIPGSKLLAGGVIGLLAIGCFVFWSHAGNEVYLPYTEYNPTFRDGLDLPAKTNVYLQKDLILSDPTRLIKAASRSVFKAAWMYMPGYIGTFGWLDTHLSTRVILFAYSFLFLIFIFDRGGPFSFTWKQRGIIVLAFMFCYFMVILSQLLAWEMVGSLNVGTIQGRYILPFTPLLALAFSRGGERNHFLKYGAIVGSTLLLLLSINKIYFRYYTIPNEELVAHFSCDAEQTIKQYFVDNDGKTLYKFCEGQTKEQAFSGEYSIKLNASNSFAASIPFYECFPGDTLRIKVQRLGSQGGFILQSDDVFQSFTEPNARSTESWKPISTEYILDARFAGGKKIDLFLYNQGDSYTYFDDFEISYLRKQD